MRRDATGERRTRQRDVIRKVLDEAEGPLTVEGILERGQALLPGLGIATVYRTVKRLVSRNEIQPVSLPDGKPRYEPEGREHHFHFLCERCVRAWCLPACPLEGADTDILPGGFRASEHALTVFGVCPACAEARRGR